MDKSNGQSGRTAASAPTREKLMAAAAELIAELGWGRVTTRARAERAGLPHGAVSYHFRGKQELLTEAAMFAFARAIPAEQIARGITACCRSAGQPQSVSTVTNWPFRLSPAISRALLSR